MNRAIHASNNRRAFLDYAAKERYLLESRLWICLHRSNEQA